DDEPGIDEARSNHFVVVQTFNEVQQQLLGQPSNPQIVGLPDRPSLPEPPTPAPDTNVDPRPIPDQADQKPADQKSADQKPADQKPADQKSSDQKPDNQVAPPGTTSAYPPPGLFARVLSSLLYGDTHLTSLDGLHFDHQQIGEYVLVTSNNDFQIQVRQQPYGSSRTISIATAVAMNVAGDRVGIYLKRTPKLMVNGTPMTLRVGATPLPKGGQIKYAADQFEIVWPDGSTVHVDASGRSSINVQAALASSRKNHAAGLLGDWNGDPSNDLMARDRTIVPIASIYGTTRQVYTTFTDSWRIGSSDSLFDYGSGESADSFNSDRQFPYTQVSSAGLDTATRQAAERSCRAAGLDDGQFLDDCVLDVGETNDQDFARGAAAAAATSTTSLAATSWSGTWNGKVVLVDKTTCHLTEEQASRSLSFTLAQTGSQVTGTVHWTSGTYSPTTCRQVSTLNVDLPVAGTVSNGHLVGQVTGSGNGLQLDLTRFSANSATGAAGPLKMTVTKTG
ncbi:MAG TPA: VWD domain-containing protein, partial [Chloroflexota bacterium]|nr:VWD domain-containing protein [Chloroflexota bacterium]